MGPATRFVNNLCILRCVVHAMCNMLGVIWFMSYVSATWYLIYAMRPNTCYVLHVMWYTLSGTKYVIKTIDVTGSE